MTIEIVDFPIKNGDFPWQNVSSPEGIMKEGQVSGAGKCPMTWEYWTSPEIVAI